MPVRTRLVLLQSAIGRTRGSRDRLRHGAIFALPGVLLLLLGACATLRQESLEPTGSGGRTLEYSAPFEYPYRLALAIQDNVLVSQYLQASDLTLTQNVDGSRTVSFGLSLTSLTIVANLDQDGHVVEMQISDGKSQETLRWDQDGDRID